MSHRIEMTYTANSIHSGETKTIVAVERDGSIDHAIETFRAFLIAMGFSADVAAVICDREE